MSWKLKLSMGAVVGLCIAIQAIQPRRTNPPVAPERGIETQLRPPEEVLSILRRSCRDCHSHETRWPWYAYVSPVSWRIAADVREGREHMNLSDWAGYGREDAALKLGKLCEEVRKGAMPLPRYRRIHTGAALSPAEVETLCTWAKGESKRLLHEVYRGPGPPEREED